MVVYPVKDQYGIFCIFWEPLQSLYSSSLNCIIFLWVTLKLFSFSFVPPPSGPSHQMVTPLPVSVNGSVHSWIKMLIASFKDKINTRMSAQNALTTISLHSGGLATLQAIGFTLFTGLSLPPFYPSLPSSPLSLSLPLHFHPLLSH